MRLFYLKRVSRIVERGEKYGISHTHSHGKRNPLSLPRSRYSGPLVLCLHGFPDNAYTYRTLLPALAEAGFHAVAPFMRGYAPTSAPADGPL